MEISILTDGGRCCRPLYHMENNKLSITPKHIQDLKSNKQNWLDLVYGSSGKKGYFRLLQL